MSCERCGWDGCSEPCPSGLAIGDNVYWTGGSQDLPPIAGVFRGFEPSGKAKFEDDAGEHLVILEDLTLVDKWPVLMS